MNKEEIDYTDFKDWWNKDLKPFYKEEDCCENIIKLRKEIFDLQSQLTKANNKIEKMEKDLKSGDLSDGYHTFNDLYYQRCILFATIVNQNKDISWKSKRHEDGQKCFNSDNWFIVGIDTPKGSYTYHYEAKYWDLFDCIELENGKHWDGHTERDVDRLLSIIGGVM